MKLTIEQLQSIMPNLPLTSATLYIQPLNEAMVEFEINTPLRISAFLAQLAHESGELHYWEEIATGQAYEGRVDLGNINVGDGRRYKGRGPIQLTGRANYIKAGKALNLDLEQHPEQAALSHVGFRTAGWYWYWKQLNKLADLGDFDTITKKINGGFNGKAQRDRYYVDIKKVLGC